MWVQSDFCFICRLIRSGLTSIEASAINCTQVKLTRLYLVRVSVESHIPSSGKNSYLKRAARRSVVRHRLVTTVLFVTDSTEVTVLTHTFRRASDHIKVLFCTLYASEETSALSQNRKNFATKFCEIFFNPPKADIQVLRNATLCRRANSARRFGMSYCLYP